jgi:hypothetical protein
VGENTIVGCFHDHFSGQIMILAASIILFLVVNSPFLLFKTMPFLTSPGRDLLRCRAAHLHRRCAAAKGGAIRASAICFAGHSLEIP